MTDHEKTKRLLHKIGRGQKEAMNALMKLWYSRVYHFAWRYTGDRNLSFDIAQRVFIIVWSEVQKLKDPGKFKFWLYRIAINESKSLWKDRKRMEPKEITNAMSIEEPGLNAQACLEKTEKIELIKRALRLLPDEQAQVVIMKEYENLKFREIADILQIPESTVKSRMYYGLKALKKILLKYPTIKDMYHEAT